MYLTTNDSPLPLPTFAGLQKEMNRLFDHALGGTFENGGTRTWAPPVEIYDTEDELVVVAELPGFDKSEIHISFEDGRLHLSGSRGLAREGRNHHRNERQYGRFERSFQLPAAYDADKIEAELGKGLLTITLPKREEAKARQIPVTAS